MSSFQPVQARSAIKRDNKHAAIYKSLVCPTAPVDVLSGVVDIRGLSQQQRQGLLSGPTITITHGGVPVAQVCKRILMACSQNANTHISVNLAATQIALPASCVDFHALKTVLSWMSAYYVGGLTVRQMPMGFNTVEACKILRAAAVLGMRPYVAHIAAYFHRYIGDQSCLMDYAELTALLAAVKTDDALFKHLAKDLAIRRFQKRIPDSEVFAEFLKENPTLGKAMQEIDAAYAEERKVRREERIKAHKATARAQENPEQKQYKKKLAQLVQKLDKHSGGVIFMSAEEAQMKRKHGL
jgi:hypothetical protein